MRKGKSPTRPTKRTTAPDSLDAMATANVQAALGLAKSLLPKATFLERLAYVDRILNLAHRYRILSIG